jgi:hypothetical protein
MKRLTKYISFFLILTVISGCDKGFEKVNKNPTLPTSLDPSYLFANAQLNSAIYTLQYQAEIVQQIITPFTGVLEGGNHNVWFFANNVGSVFTSLYTGPVKLLADVLDQTKDDPSRSNLYNIARIWRCYIFQVLVDTYGYVPYFDAGAAYLNGVNLPKYDSDKEVYDDLLKELSDATNKLDGSKKIETNDLFYAGNIQKWKKLGNSLLLRVAMRLSKVNPEKAKQFVNTATDVSRGGLMESNSDNAFIPFNSIFNNPNASSFQGTERANFYLAKPFIDHLKNTEDPRLKVIAIKYEIPANPIGTTGAEDTNPDHQQGMPYGYNDATISTEPNYPGKIGAAWKYSQLNRKTLAKIDAPEFFITYSQTQLLLAEAAQRGWINGSAETYYNTGVRAHMDQMAQYDPSATISKELQNTYMSTHPFNPANALEQINTQYWISSFLNGSEAWANFRRSGFPDLEPNPYPGADPVVKGDFIHRLQYPSREISVNAENYKDAVARMGADNMATRVFWDVK